MVINQEKIQKMESMDFPLTHYYINSCISPYDNCINIPEIFNFSDDTEKIYLNEKDYNSWLPLLFALRRGVRYMEIEVWDGEFINQEANCIIIEPYIQFGYTMNSKLFFSQFL